MTVEQEIEALVHRFSSAAGNLDPVEWASTWCSDGHWSLGDGREFFGRDDIVNAWVRGLADFSEVTETTLNGDCDIDLPRRTGRGRWYFQRAYLSHNGLRSIMLAHYDDSYSIEGGEWRFASRRMVQLLSGPEPGSRSFGIGPTRRP